MKNNKKQKLVSRIKFMYLDSQANELLKRHGYDTDGRKIYDGKPSQNQFEKRIVVNHLNR